MLFAVANGNQLTNQPQESQTIFLEDDWVLGIPLYRECWSVGIILTNRLEIRKSLESTITISSLW